MQTRQEKHRTLAYPGPRSNSALRAVILAILPVAAVAGPNFGDWGPNTPVLDTSNSVLGGCPIESRDGLTIYTASAREAGSDDLDIWVNGRPGLDEPFGAAIILPAPVNGTADDFCPSPLRGHCLMFVSTRAGGCGSGDIYIARQNPAHGWGEATRTST